MDFIKTKIDGVVIVEPKVFGDHRGFFMESYSKREFEKAGLFYDFVQDNHSSSTVKGTLRGLHFQKGDKAQAKLVRCAGAPCWTCGGACGLSAPHTSSGWRWNCLRKTSGSC